MEYLLNENEIIIDCKLSNKEKSINECKNCPSKQNCNYIEESIKKHIETLNKIEFRKFLYSQDCPKCKICLFNGKEKIQDCPIIDKENLEYKKIEDKFNNSKKVYTINEEKLKNFIKQIKEN